MNIIGHLLPFGRRFPRTACAGASGAVRLAGAESTGGVAVRGRMRRALPKDDMGQRIRDASTLRQVIGGPNDSGVNAPR